ncbi:MAG: hypothetical protein Q7S42_02690 [Candidatus Omnitrophota bacterium]|nr:hypothetical protein [Candidatus Omnitrophota bacterium]
MDKFIGTILMAIVVIICFYIFMNLDKISSFTIPVPEKVVDYFKVDSFNSNFNNSTTTTVVQ